MRFERCRELQVQGMVYGPANAAAGAAVEPDPFEYAKGNTAILWQKKEQ